MKLRIWFLALDVIVACGGFGTRPYRWVLSRVSDCIDWSDR